MQRTIIRTLITLLFMSLVSLRFEAHAQELKSDLTDTWLNRFLRQLTTGATKTDLPLGEAASTVTIIDGQTIAAKQKATVLEVLRDVPGVDVVQTGGIGRQASVFIRGAASEHTLVVLDGIELNDPISPARAYDFANLTVEGIERIEIIRGPQSAVYGSDAIGGVIHIVTSKGKGTTKLSATAESGSFLTFRESIGVKGAQEWFDYAFNVSRIDTNGISAAAEEDGNSEEDGYSNTSVTANIGVQPTPYLEGRLTSRFFAATTDLDNFGGVGGDDPNSETDTTQIFLRPQLKVDLFDDVWTQRWAFVFTDHDRDDQNDTDIDHPNESSESEFRGRTYKGETQHDIKLAENNTLTLGGEVEVEQGRSDFLSITNFGTFSGSFDQRDATTTSFYIQDQAAYGSSLSAVMGLRFDHHSRFGGETTYRIAPAYKIHQTATVLKGSFGTGFKSPSLFQLFSSFGDEDLDPETSTAWDVGIQQNLVSDLVRVEATYFSNRFKNLIEFEPNSSQFVNRAETSSRGVETVVAVRWRPELTTEASYTFTRTEDESSGDDLVRRPQHKYSLQADYAPVASTKLSLTYRFVGEREDTDFSTFPTERVTLSDYHLVDVAGSYKINRNFTLFARIENLLDSDYQEVLGFGTPGIAGFGGLRVEI